jgi:cytochrome P450 PksS
MTLQVDFTSDAFFRDPAATIARLRAAVPVVKTRFPIVGKVWITTTYEATARVLKDSATFTLRRDGALAGLSWWMPRSFATFANNMLTMDQPDHARLRGIVDEAFRRRAVLDMEPRIRAIADGLADELFAQGKPGRPGGAFFGAAAAAVICELLGLPAADRPIFIAWAHRIATFRNIVGLLRLLGVLADVRVANWVCSLRVAYVEQTSYVHRANIIRR